LTLGVDERAAIFAALGEPVRLALVDRLAPGDGSPGQLAADLGLASNLLAHHLGVLEGAGVIRRVRSEGDRRRSYIQLRLDNPTVWTAVLTGRIQAAPPEVATRLVFVCTANSARSQLAAATWSHLSSIPATSAGTHPGRRIHRGAIEVARRHGLRLHGRHPIGVEKVLRSGDLVVAVCDNAHEELSHTITRLHWSVPDPVRIGTEAAFEDAYADISRRVQHLADLYADTKGTAS
jgi:ArsR family transcriptional regulator, arsenate/arsenite/antimonite-responsive transcriptional repressor / arsenate reductase (thioredoxin)